MGDEAKEVSRTGRADTRFRLGVNFFGNKPRAVKDFARSGYLGFQDHGQKVWYKNVKVLELD